MASSRVNFTFFYFLKSGFAAVRDVTIEMILCTVQYSVSVHSVHSLMKYSTYHSTYSRLIYQFQMVECT
jgi:hypothetical protein